MSSERKIIVIENNTDRAIMRYIIRIFTAAALVISLAGAQSFFNGLIGSDVTAGSGRSAAMGATHMQNNNSSTLLQFNPAGLTGRSNWIQLDYQFLGDAIRERRGFDMKDSFEDYLTTGDYVTNYNTYGLHQAGIIANMQIADIDITGALSYIPLTSFDYNYEEEVRGGQSFEDGVIGIKDPILGFHVMESKGILHSLSFGGAAGMEIKDRGKFSFGFGIHQILESEIEHKAYVDTIDFDAEYLSSWEPYQSTADTKSASYFTIGVNFTLMKGLTGAFAFESEAAVKAENAASIFYNTEIGLPEYNFNNDGFEYIKPEKIRFGLKLIPRKKVPMVLSVELEQIKTSGAIEGIELEDAKIWKFGFEYMAAKTLPLRAGMIFRESAFKSLSPESIFTFGTGKTLGNLTIDIAGQFSVLGTYQYPDLFLIEDDVRPDLDHVNESRYHFITTLNYNF